MFRYIFMSIPKNVSESVSCLCVPVYGKTEFSVLCCKRSIVIWRLGSLELNEFCREINEEELADLADASLGLILEIQVTWTLLISNEQ